MKAYYKLVIIFILALSTNVVQGQAATDLLGRINALRSQRGLPPYTLNNALSTAATGHAQWMATTNNVSHVQTSGSRPVDRANAAGYNSVFVSENIYMGGNASINTAWNFWVNSAIHYAGLTSSNYQHLGVGTARGPGGTAYVLMFGSPNTPARSAQARSSQGTGNNAVAEAAAPSFVVGWDEYGNIMHQVQAGDTLGDIALIYGYTWDDIPTMLNLNELTEADMRSLEVGSVFLVPPQAGTYTPAPQQLTAAATIVALSDGLDTTTATPTATNTPRPSRTPTLLPTLTATQAASAMPTMALVARPIGAEATPSIAPTSTQSPELESAAISPSPAAAGPPGWLLGALTLQLVVVGLAGFEFLRRMIR